MTVTTTKTTKTAKTETITICIDSLLEDLGYGLSHTIYVHLKVETVPTPTTWSWETPYTEIVTDAEVIDIELV